MSIHSDERRTPRWLFEVLHREFHFQADVAARRENALCSKYFGPDHENPAYRDGLLVPWSAEVPAGAAVWCNMPYSRGSIAQWCQKALEESAQITCVLLLPGDTSTNYFHDYVLPFEHRFLRKRLKFEGAPLTKKGTLAPAKFGSVVLIYRPGHRVFTYA